MNLGSNHQCGSGNFSVVFLYSIVLFLSLSLSYARVSACERQGDATAASSPASASARTKLALTRHRTASVSSTPGAGVTAAAPLAVTALFRGLETPPRLLRRGRRVIGGRGQPGRQTDGHECPTHPESGRSDAAVVAGKAGVARGG